MSQGFTSYHFGQDEVRKYGQENNDAGSDEVAESAVRKLRARWKTQHKGQNLEAPGIGLPLPSWHQNFSSLYQNQEKFAVLGTRAKTIEFSTLKMCRFVSTVGYHCQSS